MFYFFMYACHRSRMTAEVNCLFQRYKMTFYIKERIKNVSHPRLTENKGKNASL